MKGFIEVTNYDGGMRVILPVDKITSIVCDKAKSVFIEMGVDNKGISSGILVTESYEEIKQKLTQKDV